MAIRTSIIIPSFNASAWLPATLRSCFAQTSPDVEIIVVDDGSTDDSREVLRAAADEDPRLRVLHQTNQGVGAARNVGLGAARGTYVNFVDADDLLEPEKVAVQAAVLDANPALDLVICDGWGIAADGQVIEPHLTVAERFAGPADLFDVLFTGGQFPPLVPLLRRHVVLEAGGFDEDRDVAGWADTELWLRIARDGARYYHLDRQLCRYRIHAGSMSADDAFMEACAQRVYSRLLAQHPVASTLALRRVQRRLVAQELALATLRAALQRHDHDEREHASGSQTGMARGWIEHALHDAHHRLASMRESLVRSMPTSPPASTDVVDVGIFGTGSGAMKVWDALAALGTARVVWFADNDERRQGQVLLGIPVLDPARALAAPVHGVIIGSASGDAIDAQLAAMGCPPDRVVRAPLDDPFPSLVESLAPLLSALPPSPGPLTPVPSKRRAAD